VISGSTSLKLQQCAAASALAGRHARIYHSGIHQGVTVMKLIRSVSGLAAVAALAVSPVYAACTAPTPPQSIPDGTTATLQQMLAGKKAVSDFNTATNAYLDCLKNEHEAALAADGPKVSDDEKAKLDKTETDKHNAAVDQLHNVADRFNEQVRAYKTKNAKS
jgi:hypothetical protein